MPIVKIKLQPIMVKFQCEVCQQGELKMVMPVTPVTDPPQFKHRCTVCGDEKIMITAYPYIEYVHAEPDYPFHFIGHSS